LEPELKAAGLRIEGLHVSYGTLAVLHDVSLTIGAGEVVGLVGANGAGKTTIVRTVCGLIRPTSGRIMKSGVDLTRVPAHSLPSHGVTVVLEGRNLFSEMTVRENLTLALRCGRKFPRTETRLALDDVLALFPMLAERFEAPARLLSGGQQQMVAIARALLLQPDLLVLDEPSTGLAPKIIKDIVEVLQRLRQRGISMLLVEQNVGMAAKLTDRAYVLSLGKIVHEIKAGEWEAALHSGEIVSAYLGGGLSTARPVGAGL
jgi:branched-chain amino acid transport system ATP-binding protein/nonpolar-amino-acid-transporting ATPase